MKFNTFLLITLFLYSCNSTVEKQKETATKPSVPLSEILRTDFSTKEQKILSTSKEIISSTYFGTFITIDKKGQPRARVMEPFAPDENFNIWVATNPKSRKVNQIKSNPNATFHYFDQNNLGYVSLMGKAILVDDNAIKATKWKDGFEKFYKNKTDAFLLIKFIPETLELISIPKGFTGDTLTWKPHVVDLR